MPSDIFIKDTTGTSSTTWKKATKIFVKTASGTTSAAWSAAKNIYLYFSSGWTRVWPLSGVFSTTSPYIAASSGSTTPLDTNSPVLRIGTTYYGKNGTWNPNGWTINSYQYKWIGYTSSDINDSSKTVDPALATYSGTVSYSLPASYDKTYLSFFVQANSSGGTAYNGYDESGNTYGRLYVVRRPPLNLTTSLSSYTPQIGVQLTYSSTWDTTAAYLEESLRTTVRWYKNSTNSVSGGTLIGSGSTYTPTTNNTTYNTGSDIGYYIYVVETRYNSGSDNDYGINTGVTATAITTSAVSASPDSFSFTLSNTGTVTTPSTPTITRVSSSSNIVLFDIASTKPADTYQYGVNQSGAGFGTRTGTPAQYVTILNQWDSNGNNNPGIYDTISTIEPGSSNAEMTISTTAYGTTRSATANVSTTSNASSWAINFSWSGASTSSVTYYNNGTGTLSSSTAATVTVYTNSMPVKIADITGSADPTITINNVTAYYNTNQSGGSTAGTSGGTTSLTIGRPTATSASTTQYYTYYNPVPVQTSAPYISGASGQLTVQYPGSITWYGGSYTNASSVTSVLLYGTTTATIQSSTSNSYRTANPYSLANTDPVAPAYYFGVRDTVVGINGITYYYYSYPNTYALAALGNALTPSLSAATSTNGGFYFDVNNYDSSYAWSSSIDTTPGTVSGPTTTSPYRVTVSGLGYSVTRTITVSTSKTGYNNGSAQRSGTSNAAPAVSVNSYPSISGTGAAGSSITFGAGSYNNASSITTTLRVSTSTSFSTSSGSKGSTSPYTVTTSDASAPAYYFATLDTVIGVNGLTYYFWSGGYSGSSATIPSGSGSILSYIPSYTITWNANGGSPTTSSTATDGSTVYAPTGSTVTRSGYTLLYWRDTPSLDYTYSINPGGAWTIDGRSRTFYARWQASTSAPTTVTVTGDNALTVGGTFRWSADGSPTPTYQFVIGYNATSSTGPFTTKYTSASGLTTTSWRPYYDGGWQAAGYYRCTVTATNSAGSASGSNVTYMS